MIPPIASNFVAAESLSGALDYASSANSQNIGVIFNLLGEHYENYKHSQEDANEYQQLIANIENRDVDASVSIKPSQIGLGIGSDVFRENLAQIVDSAIKENVFVWVDMEDHLTTDETLDAVIENSNKDNSSIGVAIQANLKRTESDLKQLADTDAIVRLVKGAYDEPASIAYQEKEQVNKAYEKHLEYLFTEFRYVAVGSHDPRMVSLAKQLHNEHGTPYEIQMLMGVRSDAQIELAREGIDVVRYVPYGSKWAQYFYRRLMERKENILFAARAILS